jgi:peptide subunit release factor RF-3
MTITAKTYGKILDEKILPAVEAAYVEQFPKRKFTNYRKGDLAGKVTIIKGSRHENFLDAINSGPVVLVFFATALQGFSIEADLEQMADLPERTSRPPACTSPTSSNCSGCSTGSSTPASRSS